MITNLDRLSHVVCNFRTPQSNGMENVGTGIFIEIGWDAYLLTAEHVVNEINNKSYLVLQDENDAPWKLDLNFVLGGAAFQIHKIADLAIAKINIKPNNTEVIRSRCLSSKQIDMSDDLISRDVELTTIGFPQGLGASGAKLSPLSYKSYVSGPAITLRRADNQKPCDFIVLDRPSVGGYSGGPTFDLGYTITRGLQIKSDGIPTLKGIVHGTISDDTGGKLAAITPNKYLRDFF